MTPIIIPATSLNISVGLHEGMPGQTVSDWPVVTMNYPPLLAKAIVEEIFRPYAKPEHFFVGINPSGHDFEISLHAVIALPHCAALPLAEIEAALAVDAERQTPPFVYLLGNETDFNAARVSHFLDRKNELGRFYVSCGIHPARSCRQLIVNRWLLPLEIIHGGDMKTLLLEAMTAYRR